MLKIIFKNLWNRRRNNVWLFVELIIITIFTWFMADHVIVIFSDRTMPAGYDADRLVIVRINSLPSSADGYDAAYDSLKANTDAVNTMLDKLRALPGVESVCHMRDYPLPGGQSNSMSHYRTGDPGLDTVVKTVNTISYAVGGNFFETFGIKAVKGSPSAEELSRHHINIDNEIIISREYAHLLWPGQNAVGKEFIGRVDPATGDTARIKVIGVVEGIRWISTYRSYANVFTSWDRWSEDEPASAFTAVLRLGENTGHTEFINELRARHDITAGNFYIRSVTDYPDMIHHTEESYGIHTEQKLMMLLSLFFLLNLILGTIGCFWLQTRRRTEEIGVLRSFGARRSDIVRMFVGESVLLATISFVIGDLLYLQYALRNGLDTGGPNNNILNVADNWVSSFGEHFAIISAVVYAVLIACVIIGTLIPAANAARINVSDALRDE